MTYVDDENDRITLSSDAELAEAAGLALSVSPAVLRLSLVLGNEDAPKPSHTSKRPSAAGRDVPTRDANTNTDTNANTDTNTNTNTNTGTNMDTDTNTDHGTHATPPEGPEGSLARLIKTIAAQLPAAIAQMPEGVRNLIPTAELDVAATIAANAADNASCIAADACKAASAAAAAAAATCPFAPGCHVPMADEPAVPGVHSGVTCDKSGQCPIVGNRYHLVGHNYDLCEAEWQKLDDKEKALFCKVPPPPPPPPPVDLSNNTGANNPGANNTANPGGHAGSHFKDAVAKGVHPGVECDRSGMCPIVGMRYQLRGHNYDLCQAEYDKLGE